MGKLRNSRDIGRAGLSVDRLADSGSGPQATLGIGTLVPYPPTPGSVTLQHVLAALHVVSSSPLIIITRAILPIVHRGCGGVVPSQANSANPTSIGRSTSLSPRNRRQASHPNFQERKAWT